MDSHVTPEDKKTFVNNGGRTVKVWDFPTRIFHWVLAILVMVAWASSEADGRIFWLHVYSGIVLLGFVGFRIVWGFIGSRHALFSDFVYGSDTVTDYARRLMAFRPPYMVGHNPVGGWMVLALLAVVALASLSGLMVDKHGYVGPLAHIGGGFLGRTHEGFTSILIFLIVVHVVGVFVHGFIARENLPRAMVTGDKHVPADVTDEAIKPVGWFRPFIAVAVGVAVALYFMRL